MPIPPEIASQMASTQKRILIVDDDPDMVDALKRLFIRDKKYDLEVAYDGFEADRKFPSLSLI